MQKRKRNTMIFVEESKTHQAFRDECNINNIMAKYEKTKLITHINERAPQYADVSNYPDYQEALDKIEHAQTLFDELPAKVRKEFNNDPAQFCDFVQTTDNIEKLADLGLINQREEAKAPELIPKAGDTGKIPEGEATSP